MALDYSGSFSGAKNSAYSLPARSEARLTRNAKVEPFSVLLISSASWEGLVMAVDLPSLSLGPGEQMLLTASSGAGKSTLLQLIAGLLDPMSGTVSVDGQMVHGLRADKRDAFRGRKIGMIFQTFNLLLGFTALENVMAALLFSTIPAREHSARAGT